MTLDFVQCIYDFFKLFSLNLNTITVHDNPASVNIFFGLFSQFFFANAEVFRRFFNRQSIFFPDRHISIVHNLCTPFTVCCFLQADRRLWKAPLVSQLFPFLWAEPHHADVSLFCEDRSWQNDFSNSRSRITAWVARFLLKRSWRTVPVARYLTNVSVCFIQLSKSCGESVLLSCKNRCRAGKR